jgi:hypothetical protein
MSSSGRLSSPQRFEMSAGVAVGHDNGSKADIDVPSPTSPHDAADGTAAADGPVYAGNGVAST